LILEFRNKKQLPSCVRRGLLTPETNGKGGRNPYQVFTAEHVRAEKLICTAQSLGLSLKDLAAIGKERQVGRLTPEFSIAILSAQLGKLETRATELKTMTRYLREPRSTGLQAANKVREQHRSSAPDDLQEPRRQGQTCRTVGVVHSSDGPSGLAVAEIRVIQNGIIRFAAYLNPLLQQNLP
jgi:DNA-binding transcriptional MerR regulator